MNNIILGILSVIATISIIVVGLYLSKFFNAATLQTQVIAPEPGVKCIVVSATDSTSVDCWMPLQEPLEDKRK